MPQVSLNLAALQVYLFTHCCFLMASQKGNSGPALAHPSANLCYGTLLDRAPGLEEETAPFSPWHLPPAPNTAFHLKGSLLFLPKMLLALVTGRVANLEIGSLVDLDSFAVPQEVSGGVHWVHLSRGARTTLWPWSVELLCRECCWLLFLGPFRASLGIFGREDAQKGETQSSQEGLRQGTTRNIKSQNSACKRNRS